MIFKVPPGGLIHFKRGVDRSEIHPILWAWLGAVSLFHYEETGAALEGEAATMTSGRRPYKPSSSSKHAPPPGELATAADLRRHALDRRGLAEKFCMAIQASAGYALGVVLEPEWLTVRQLERRFGIRIRTEAEELAARRRVGPHIHLQLKGRLWTPAGS